MPIPFIIWGIVAATTALVGVLTTIVFNWDEIVIWWKGKKIAILGAEATGKTRLFTFLTEGKFSEEWKKNQNAKKTKSKILKLKDLELYIKKSIDYSGLEERKELWENTFKESDIILYLFKVNKVLEKDEKTNQRIIDDLKTFMKWKESANSTKIFIAIGTFLDEFSEFNSIAPNRIDEKLQEYSKQIHETKWYELFKKMDGIEVLKGSMKDNEGIEKIVIEILNIYKQKGNK